MSNPLSVQADTQQPRLPALVAGARVQAIVPSDFDGAWRIANAVVRADMAPKGLDTPEKAMVAIMHGMEVGLTPMAALQSIAVVNGRPSIWGDGALALVRASGILEWIEEKTELRNGSPTAICRVKRRGEPNPIERTFSDEDAKTAGLFGKTGPWTQYRARMRLMRARAFALRDGFADVLRGLHIAEEMQDIPARDVSAIAVPAAPPVPPPAPIQIEATRVTPPSAPTAAVSRDVDRIVTVEDPNDFIDNLDGLLAAANTVDDLNEIYAVEAEPAINNDAISSADVDRANGLYDKHRARIEG